MSVANSSVACSRFPLTTRWSNSSIASSSTRLVRIAVLDDVPSIDKGEVTDKGSINQRSLLGQRKHIVEALYDERGHPQVIALETVI